jgi:predicted TIM-barrel fold metal-dependent hydrolase
MTVDAHHHLWDPSQGKYPWMTGPFAPLRREYGPRHLLPELAASYGQVLSAVRDALGDTGRPQADRIFGRNAIDVYRLNIRPISPGGTRD